MNEKIVQNALGSLMPVMGPERWAELRPAIAALVNEEVRKANNAAQVAMIRMQLRHDRCFEIERAKHQAELETLQQLVREALQEA